MGYRAWVEDVDFEIYAEDIPDARRALQAWAELEPRVSYANVPNILAADSLEEVLDELGWSSEIDVDGNLVYLEHNWEKLGCESRWFSVLAPYVVDGSFIEFRGEDGDRWKYVFDEAEMSAVRGHWVWHDA